MGNVLDTFLNIEVFAFIGLLVWLYFKPVAADRGDSAGPKDIADPE
jgi:hypothetical protein